MNRNMLRRIELAWPVTDPVLRQRVIDECLVPYLLDARDAWTMDSAGGYRRVALPPGVDAHGAQESLMQLHNPRAVDARVKAARRPNRRKP